ncbi:MAG: hypothetical protein KDA71_20380, partial [Planctomycetales bacterium]|nr:hypothetical protein [Planctomycetales bacterium]
MEPFLEAADSAADAILSTDHSQERLATAAGIATVDCPVVSSVQAGVNRTTGLDAAERIPAGLEQSIQRTCRWLFDRLHADGHWSGELEGDSILQSEYILLLAWLGEERTEPALRAARRLLEQQNPDGGWGMFPGSEMDISASVKA